MKKYLIAYIILFIGLYAQSQVNPHAIGLRLGGDGQVNGAEISYQHGLGEMNRLELDLGFGGNKNYSRIFITGSYHWNWNITNGLNWYVGPGASLGFYSYDDSKNYINIGLGGQIGLEYDFNEFNLPILLSIDFRPMVDLIGDNSGLGWGVALGIRYIW